MLAILIVVALVVGIVLGKWLVTHRDTIRVYRDHLERAAAETAPPETRPAPGRDDDS